MTRAVTRWATGGILGALLVSNCVAWELRQRQKCVAEQSIPLDGSVPVEEPVDIAGLRAPTAIDLGGPSLGRLEALGRVADLADARFDRENGSRGLWRRLDFLFGVGRGTYFLEACDPARTPVLFVHGITGGPRDFEAILAGMERRRFEPWLYYYASGAPLDQVSDHLAEQVAKLGRRCRFGELYVVAHSMGG
ncbi:MAG: alpha/beta hydrolase, partial [Candidatus Rokubacteria bacterium]|nr:alpha/beta hydrolase [Candidatus Rokubacteria bacterium]